MEQWPLPRGWEWKTLAEVCTINPRRPVIRRDDGTPTSFVPMAAVDEVAGEFKEVLTRPYHEVRRGFTYFEENDVVFAKITPSMENGKAAIARNLIDGFGFGTTEFHVFRPAPGILPEWIHRYIRRLGFRQEAKEHFRGAVGQQRVPQDFLETYPIPMPYPANPTISLDIQHRIVSRLDVLLSSVAEAKKLQSSIKEDGDDLVKAVLVDIFPDPEKDMPSGWVLKTVKDISATPQYGYTQSANDEPVGPKFLRITDIQNGQVDWSSVPYCECSQGDLAKYRLHDGDIVFARSGATTGKTFLVKEPPEAVFASYLIRLRIERDTTPDFVYWFFQSPFYWSQVVPRGGAQPNMNAQVLKQVKVPVTVDPLAAARIVANLKQTYEQILKMRHTQESESGLLNEVEQALLTQAFRGEL